MLSFYAVIKGAVLRGAPSVVNPSCRNMFSLYSLKRRGPTFCQRKLQTMQKKARNKET